MRTNAVRFIGVGSDCLLWHTVSNYHCTSNLMSVPLCHLPAEPETEDRDIKHAVSFFDRAQRAFQQELANVAAAASGASAENHSSAVLDLLAR